MLTANIINGHSLPADCRIVRNAPREFSIPTVDFVYQRMTMLACCMDKDWFHEEYKRGISLYGKVKKRILAGDNEIELLLLGSNTLVDNNFDVLSVLIGNAEKKNKLISDFAEEAHASVWDVISTTIPGDSRAENELKKTFVLAANIFWAATCNDDAEIRKCVKKLPVHISTETEIMQKFVKEAIGELWDCKTIGDIILHKQKDIPASAATMPELGMLFPGEQKKVADTAIHRPKVDMCISSFQLSACTGIRHTDIYSFALTDLVKHRLCEIMASGCTVAPSELSHGVAVDRGMEDAYTALVWEYAISEFANAQQRNAILERSMIELRLHRMRVKDANIQAAAERIKIQEAELRKEQRALGQVEELKKVRDDYFNYKVSSKKREDALRSRIRQLKEKIEELETKYNTEHLCQCTEEKTAEVSQLCAAPENVTADKEVFIDYREKLRELAKVKKLVFVGGNQNYINNLRASQPDITYVNDTDVASCDMLIAHCDAVIFRTSQMSHSLYYKIKAICKNRDIPIRHIESVTAIPLTEELIYKALTKEVSTQNG